MRATARGRLLLALVAALALSALPLQSLAPVLGAALLLGLVAAARDGVRTAHVQARIHAPSHAPVDAPFLVTVEVEVTPPLPCRVRLAVPPTLTVDALDEAPGAGTAAWEAALRPRSAGRIHLRGADVAFTDPLGLWSRHVPLGEEAAVRVLPEEAYARVGAGIGRVEQLARGRRAFEQGLDVDRVRPYRVGDRLRDLDWNHSSKLQALMTREHNLEAPRPIVALVDATRTMRWRRAAAMNDTAARVVMLLSGLARRNNLPMGMVVYGDLGVLKLVRTAHSHAEGDALARALADLPEAVPMAHVPSVTRGEAQLSDPERRFLAAVSPFVQGPLPGAAPLEAALAAVASASAHPSLVVFVTSVDHAPRAAVAAVKRLLRRGHLVAVVSPSLPAHFLTPAEAQERPALVQWALLNRAHARRRLERLRVPLVVVRSGNEVDGVAEVAAWAR